MNNDLKAMVAAQILASQVGPGFSVSDPVFVKQAVDVAEAIETELALREEAFAAADAASPALVGATGGAPPKPTPTP